MDEVAQIGSKDINDTNQEWYYWWYNDVVSLHQRRILSSALILIHNLEIGSYPVHNLTYEH